MPPVDSAIFFKVVSSRRDVTGVPFSSFAKSVPPVSLGTGTSSPVVLPTPTVKILTPFLAADCAAAIASPPRSSPSVIRMTILSAAARVWRTSKGNEDERDAEYEKDALHQFAWSRDR